MRVLLEYASKPKPRAIETASLITAVSSPIYNHYNSLYTNIDLATVQSFAAICPAQYPTAQVRTPNGLRKDLPCFEFILVSCNANGAITMLEGKTQKVVLL